MSRFLRFLLSTLCLLFLGSPAMAQEAKNVLVLYGNNAELPWIKIFDASLRAAASAGTKYRIESLTDTGNIVLLFGVLQQPREQCKERAA